MQPTKIADRYRVESQVGQGGMGAVWLCVDEKLGRQVALKQVVSGTDESAPDHTRALREARSLAALNQRNVVSVYDALDEHGEIWLVMEYVPGRSLAQVLEAGPLTPEETVAIGAQIADGLAAAHERGITHRDVKPANILITDEGVAKIGDFGIALMAEDPRLTRTGLVTGTPSYFAPEVARGEDPAPAADVWALGVTLYVAVEGHGPYAAHDNALAILNEIVSKTPPRPKRAGFLTETLGRTLDPDPSSRWSMADLAHVLHRLADKHAVTHTRITTGPVAATPRREPTRTHEVETPVQTPVKTPAPAKTEPPPVARRETRTATQRPGRRRGLALLGVLALLVVVAGVGFLLLQGTATATGRRADRQVRRGREQRRHGLERLRRRLGQQRRRLGQPRRTSSTATTPRCPRTPGPAGPRSPSDFQDSVGTYADYRGFWGTISDVQVNDVTSVGDDAVDVDLTYVKKDGELHAGDPEDLPRAVGRQLPHQRRRGPRMTGLTWAS